MGKLGEKKKKALESLCVKQQTTLVDPCTAAIEAEKNAFDHWSFLSKLEEDFLKQRSKVHWLQVGDKNNKYFHSAIQRRLHQNTIHELINSEGTRLLESKDIKAEAVGFFESFLNIHHQSYTGAEHDQMQELITFRCSTEQCSMLVNEVSEEEIRQIIFGLKSSKAPGPDGYTSEFFKASWTVVGRDVVTAIKSFFTTGFLPSRLNATILALIPKKEKANSMKDFRPISCCNVLYKVISKILANRLKTLLPSMINNNQSAFVRGRLLIENVLLASELVKDYHKEHISPRCAIQIDISKAFDSVEWGFLEMALLTMGIPERFCQWIMTCVKTASFSVQVNGELAGHFRSSKGLRQGCALSPYLFVISLNVLSLMLNREAEARRIGYHPKCKLLKLTHLCFADDIMVFVDGSKDSIAGVFNVFNQFESWSGLKISMEKSLLFIAGFHENEKRQIAETFGVRVGALPVRYLGLPLMSKRFTCDDYKPLIERIKAKMCSWSCRLLSFAGRLQLISSVIYSITNFWISAFRLPKKCLEEIERLCSSFLWSGPDLNYRKTKLRWEDVCRPHIEGGLGLRRLTDANKVCCLKLIWRLVSREDTLWVRWIWLFLIRKFTLWSVPDTPNKGSWMWRKILKYRNLAKQMHRVRIGNGENTSFWYDTWHDLGSLHDLTGPRGVIDLGLSLDATVAEAVKRRPHRQRSALLSQIEDILAQLRREALTQQDTHLWLGVGDTFKPFFSSKHTNDHIRNRREVVSWSKCVWFKNSTPKYSFMLWLALSTRLATMDRIAIWNPRVSTACTLCNSSTETVGHLFFECTYSETIWHGLASRLMGAQYSTIWTDLTTALSNNIRSGTHTFLARTSLQVALHYIWCERNARRHGKAGVPREVLYKLIEKTIRNVLEGLRRTGNKRYPGCLGLWFETRPP